MNKILITGSTGQVGRTLMEQLTLAGVEAVAAARNPAAATGGTKVVRFDYLDQATFEPALSGVDRVFLLLPPATPADQSATLMTPFIQAAAAHRAKLVLLSSLSAEFDPTEPTKVVEDIVRGSGAPFVILRPNWFMDNFHTFWLAPIREGVIPLPAADSSTAFIDVRDIAAAAAVALQSSSLDGRTIPLSGPEALTYSQAAAVLSSATGRDIHYVPVDDDTFRSSLEQAGLAPEFAGYITGLFSGTREGAASHVLPTFGEVTGRIPYTLAQYALDHRAAWI